jgi:AcrR family transcriptional regulator
MRYMKRQRQTNPHRRDELTARCLAAFVQAGTIDLSLDRLAESVKISKRMLVHYFGNRETIEERAMTLLEEKLRAQFAPELFPAGSSLKSVMSALWKQTTDPKSRRVLLVVMDVSRRAWNGSKRAQQFYAQQQRLWIRLLMNFSSDQGAVEEMLHRFQGALLAYLVSGDPEPGRRSLARSIRAGTQK